MFGENLKDQFSKSLLDAAKAVNDKTVADEKVAKEEKERLAAEEQQDMIGQFDETSHLSQQQLRVMGKKLTRNDAAANRDSPAMLTMLKKIGELKKPKHPMTDETELDGTKLDEVAMFKGDPNDLFTAEELAWIDEGILGGMFLPPTTRLMGALSGTYPIGRLPIGHGGGSRTPAAPANNGYRNPKDRDQRADATVSYARERHVAQHGIGLNLRAKSTTKSGKSMEHAIAVDKIHSSVMSQSPTDYSVSPSHAIDAYFRANPQSPALTPEHVKAYVPHYNRAMGVEESVDLASAALMIGGSIGAGAYLGGLVNRMRKAAEKKAEEKKKLNKTEETQTEMWGRKDDGEKDAEHRKGVRDAENDFKKKAPKGSSAERKAAFKKAKRGEL